MNCAPQFLPHFRAINRIAQKKPFSFKRHRFPAAVICHAVWLHARDRLSFRDIEELLSERGLEVSNETARRWFLKFGIQIAADLRRTRPRSNDRWHLDEMVIAVHGEYYWLWRAVDDEEEVLDFLVQKRRDAPAAMRLMKKLPRK